MKVTLSIISAIVLALASQSTMAAPAEPFGSALVHPRFQKLLDNVVGVNLELLNDYSRSRREDKVDEAKPAAEPETKPETKPEPEVKADDSVKAAVEPQADATKPEKRFQKLLDNVVGVNLELLNDYSRSRREDKVDEAKPAAEPETKPESEVKADDSVKAAVEPQADATKPEKRFQKLLDNVVGVNLELLNDHSRSRREDKVDEAKPAAEPETKPETKPEPEVKADDSVKAAVEPQADATKP
ncbi:hypothetical protein BJ085DRAFT_33840 [Dimargaris cristalligena]|uniref:Uncharacterized protein n=1 Tax=Dimargaris cristalligena TaxID=215637 RepID=A0A4P9ZVX3_9FUNG|nr:hypothetical protein BJ085DRAFT_33840 [Dimargaris cristalligena]|eukprot:RKP37002.1 hypothetical protein BJ085DRAFT_33840 [Dimargaris cristalligena]